MKVNINLKEATIEAVVIRADGTREDRGVIAHWKRGRLSFLWQRLRSNLSFIFTLAIFTLAFLLHHPTAIFAAGPFFMDAGKAIVTNLLSGLGGTVPKYHAMGTGAGPSNSTATALSTEVETRATGTPTRTTTTVTNDTYQSVGTQTATATRAITEVGLFDASTSGNCLIMSGISTINLANGDSLQTTFKLQFS